MVVHFKILNIIKLFLTCLFLLNFVNQRTVIFVIDPCEDIDRENDLIDDGTRSPYCISGQSSLCDHGISGWYRVLNTDKSNELALPQLCPESGSCGTDNPIWLNGKFCYILYIVIINFCDVKAFNYF